MWRGCPWGTRRPSFSSLFCYLYKLNDFSALRRCVKMSHKSIWGEDISTSFDVAGLPDALRLQALSSPGSKYLRERIFRAIY